MADLPRYQLDPEAIWTDRTRIIAYQECPRRRYYHSHFPTSKGHIGIQPVKVYIPFATGAHTHHGLACLLSGMDTDMAVEAAVTAYRAEVARRGIQLELGEDESAVCAEQVALTEGMIRAYALVKLPELFNEFEVLEVEYEDVWPFAALETREEPKDIRITQIIEPKRIPINLMVRADALLREKNSQDLYIQSFKTAASYDRRTESEANHDVQGLSEAAATEVRLNIIWQTLRKLLLDGWIDSDGTILLGEDKGNRLSAIHDLKGRTIPLSERMLAYMMECDNPPKISGIRMEYLLKGRRQEYPEDSGIYVQYSPLVRGYVKEGIEGPEYGWKREFRDEGTGSKRRLDYRTWKAFNAWEQNGGVKAWIELLATGTIQPDAGDCLTQQFVTPIPYMRQEDDLRDWYEQTVTQETRIALALKEVEEAREAGEMAYRSTLNRFFPQHRRSCDWPSKCAFVDVCYGTNVRQDPVASGLFQPREPHHGPEMELVKIGAAK